MADTDLARRFYAKIKKTAYCWLWLAANIESKGYGLIKIGAPSRKNILAHRLAWELKYGPVPRGLCVLHKCDNRACVNPSHLFLGTLGDNNRDAANKLRAGKRLTAAKVIAIKKLIKAGELKQAEIAARFGVTQPMISQIKLGNFWKALEKGGYPS